MLYLLIILLPVLAGILVNFIKDKKSYHMLSVIANIATFILVLILMFTNSGRFELFKLTHELTFAFNADSLSKLFAVLVSFIFMLVSIYNTKYLEHENNERRFVSFMLISLASLLGLVISSNLFTLYLFFEFMTLITFPLVLNSGSKESIMASIKYLAYSIAGASLVLAGFFILATKVESIEFVSGGVVSSIINDGNKTILLVAYLLMAIGFGAKAGMMPLHAWLPVAHPVAPSSASAVLSGLITKMGVFSIIRVTFYLFGANVLRGSFVQPILLSLAILTVFVGSMLASKENILKKRLAFSTVSQVSYALFGVFLFNEIGLIGALLQIVYHALSKNALFLGAGSIIYKAGKTKVSELDGLGKAMPLTFFLFFVNGLSLIGIPPTGGFISKWYLAAGALNNPLETLGVVVLLISALLTAYYMLQPVIKGFFNDKIKHSVKEVSINMNLPIVILTVTMLVLAIMPNILLNYFEFIKVLF